MYHKIIRLMPPHDTYIEPFVGGGAVLRHKAPAPHSIVIDLDVDVARRWNAIATHDGPAADKVSPPPKRWRALPLSFLEEHKDLIERTRFQLPPSMHVYHGDGIKFLQTSRLNGRELVYADPPYVMATRRAGAIYRHEMTDAQHQALLAALARLPCPFMLSGYRNAMYDDAADRHGWRRIDFQAMTRGGPATESLWMNFEPSAERHDYRYLGENFRERERLKRQQKRWRERLAKMPRSQQLAMMQILQELTAEL